MHQYCYCHNGSAYPYYPAHVHGCPPLHDVVNDTDGDITVYWVNAGPTVAFSKCMAGSIPGVCHSQTLSKGKTSNKFGFPEQSTCATVIDYPFVVVNQGSNYCAKWVGHFSSGVTETLSAKKILDPSYATKCVSSQDAKDAIKQLISKYI